MKALLVHNFYQSSSPSGEDVVFRNETSLLRENGIEVVTYERRNDDIAKWNAYKLVSTLQTVWSRGTFREIRDLLRKEKPDVAHFHNIWYLISPSAYYACRDAGVPVVQTCHNFRFFCANGLLMRNGRLCEACVGRIPLWSVARGCYRDSRLYTIPVAVAEGFHRIKGTWSKEIDNYIALSEFGKRKIVECGLPREKVFVKPNFLLYPPEPSFLRGDYIVFLGRLSGEKGIETLLNAFSMVRCPSLKNITLKLVGDGPSRMEIEKKIRNEGIRNVELVGRKSSNVSMAILRNARFMVMPTLCYEMFPLTTIEAFACGKAVIGSRLGAMAEIIADGKTGLLFDPGDPRDLASKIEMMLENEAFTVEMGKNARAEFDTRYTAERNFAILMDMYRRTVERQK